MVTAAIVSHFAFCLPEPMKLMKIPKMAAERSYELEIMPTRELGSWNRLSTDDVLTLLMPLTTNPVVREEIGLLRIEL